MANLTVVDLVRDDTLVVEVDLTATTEEVVAEVVDTAGLPRRTVGGTPLHYELRPTADGAPLSPHDQLGTLEGDRCVLASPDAGPTWARVHALAIALRREVRHEVDQVVADGRAEVAASVDRLRDDARQEVRSLLKDITGDLEAEARRWIQRTGRRLSVWTRRRIRRQIEEIASTGALPREVAALRQASGLATIAARSTWVLPAAAVAGVATMVAVTAITRTILIDGSDGEALRLAQQAIAQAATAQAAAQDALDSAVTAQASADDVAAGLGQHSADHDDLVLAAVDGQVGTALGEASDVSLRNADWIEALLASSQGRADSRIDAHRSTVFDVQRDRVAVRPGDSLWTIARAALSGDPAYAHRCVSVPVSANPSVSQIARYVTDLWSANTGLVGPDFSTLEVGTLLQVPCPR